MGFEQICFLGQDCDYSKNIQHSQITQTNYGTNINSSVGNDILVSFSNYAKYYKEKGVKLINCTRGGKLDCIDRKELEDVLKTSK